MNKKIYRHQRLLALAVLTVLATGLLGMSIADYQRLHTQAVDLSQKQLRLLHDGVRDEMLHIERSMDASTEVLRGQLQGADPSGIQNSLNQLLDTLPSVNAIALMSDQGILLGGVKRKNSDIDVRFIQQQLKDLSTWPKDFRVLSVDSPQSGPVLLVQHPLTNSDGKTVGMLIMGLNKSYLASRILSMHMGPEISSALSLDNGELLTLQPEPKKMPVWLSDLQGRTTDVDQPDNATHIDQHHSNHFPSHLRASTHLQPGNLHDAQWPVQLTIWVDCEPTQAIWARDSLILLVGFGLFTGLTLLAIRQSNRHHLEHAQLEDLARQTALHQRERFHLATQSAGIGVWELNLDDRLVRWDDTMLGIYGVKDAVQLLTLDDWMRYVTSEDRQRIHRILMQAERREDAFEFHFNIVRGHDGVIRNIQSRAKVHRDHAGQALRLVGVNVDITVQRQFEAALREAEERFRSSFEWAAIGMAILDPKGQFLQVNDALCTTLGYSQSEMLSMRFTSVTHPEDADLHKPWVREVFGHLRNSFQLEKRYIHKEGPVVWVHLSVSAVRDSADRVLYFIAHVQDITERKRQEAALIEREHFLRTLSECLPGLVSYWGTDLRCHFANKNHEKWSNLPSDRIRGLHLRKVMGEENYQQHKEHYDAVMRGERRRFEKKKALPTGGYADLLVHLIPDVLYGRVEGFFSISTNITDFKAQQRELERMNSALVERTEQAEAANKAKGAFLANMSHEIRTPMNAIMGLIQLMEDMELPAQQRDYIRKIGSAADVLLNVLNDILDISRVEANKLELSLGRFDLDQLLNKSMDLFSYRADEKNIRLFCTKDPECPVSLVGDRLRLAQILNNLLSNALKFTDKGHIHLQVKQIRNGEFLQFAIKDTGIGMNTEQISDLFKPFSQVDNSSSRKYGGAGLGLSICKSLAELMGGEIGVESTLGEGTTFHFTLPCTSPNYQRHSPLPALLQQGTPSTATTPEPTEQEDRPLLGKQVLVVDDHKLNRMVASEMLKKWGALVDLAENGLLAVQACANKAYDFVLMDLQMPEMDGFAATHAIRQAMGDKAPRIVAVTASASEKDRIEILRAGMCEHVVKPFKKETLIRILMETGSTPV
ncbi:MAG TPA: PAS domain S-box protein [Limnobacter sp.]|uniref:PAS domain S-box protein n=1 Tax=Limnobacter sp. TaxID=2003368 RepID=UPI002EDA5B9E